MHLVLPTCVVREWKLSDARALAHHANDRRIWRNLRDQFPHPYTQTIALKYLDRVTSTTPVTSFAIAVDGEAVGGIGYRPHEDVERVSAEIGYWLGAAFWGRGIMTAVLDAVTRQLFAEHKHLTRIYAVPYAWNEASIRVLEKAGYRFEGTLRQSAIKDGQVTDQMMYAIVRSDLS